MFPVYSSSLPHGNSHSHAHTHTTHNHHQHHPPPAHQLSDHLTAPTSTTAPATSALSALTAAASLPLYSSYQLQQKAGYLSKEGDVWKTWKRRYFVLSSQLLSYYTDRDSTVAKGHILLTGAEVRVSQRNDRSGWLFEVYREEKEAEHRVYYMEADTEQERAEWMAAIKNNILYELNRTRALVDEVDKYKARIAQLTDELERQKAKQILADLNKPRTTDPHSSIAPPPPASQQPSAARYVSVSEVQSQSQSLQQHVRTPSMLELRDSVSYLQAENARLMAENQSLKRSTLAMHGKGDEIRQTAETRTDEAAAQQQQPLPPTSAAAAAATEAGKAGATDDSEVERLRKELARVRLERSILKREVLRLMAVNDELTHPSSATTASSATQQPPQLSTAAV